MIITKCKESVWDAGAWHPYQCSRNIWKDGYCKQHHPDTKKARQEKSKAKYEEKYNKSPLVVATKRIAELEKMIKEYCPHCGKRIEIPKYEGE